MFSQPYSAGVCARGWSKAAKGGGQTGSKSSIFLRPGLFQPALRFTLERQVSASGSQRIAGLDEAGRGPLAGPVVAAACIFLEEAHLDGLNDSKQVIQRDRERLFAEITRHPKIEYGIGFASAAEVDRFNILKATFLAMSRALKCLQKPPEFILIDGNLAPAFGIPTLAVVKGDAKSPSIAAASILAKVTRDQMMNELCEQFPEYGFGGHKGYATPEHLSAIERFGPCPEHRKSFAPFSKKKETQLTMDFV